MASIFLSYAREDRASAERLARAVESAGHEVWWDRHLDSGEEFSAEIEAALEKAEVVLVAWSKLSVKSRWVRDEAAVGGDTGRLVPVSIDGTLPPMGFRQFHTLDLSDWKGGKRDGRTAELLHSVEQRLRKKEKEPAPAPRLSHPTRRFPLPTGRAVWAIAAIFALVIAVGAGLIFQNARKGSSKALKPTIALLPLTTASADPELRTLGSQTRDSIAHTFSQSGLPLRLLNAIPQGGGSAADFLITGDFSRNGDKVVATIRLDEAMQGVTVYSHQFEASRDDARDLPERIGAQMAGNLTGSTALMTLDRRHPLDPALLADLLQGEDFTSFGSLQSYQTAKRVAAKAPNSQIAQLGVAFNTSFALPDLPREERAEAVAEARRAADRSSALGPGFGDTYATWCVLRSETLFAQCEDRLRAGKRIDPDAPWLNTFLSHLLRNMGRVDEAMDLANLSYTHDVYVPTKIAWMLKTLETAGDTDEARELYQQGMRWWPGYRPMFFRNRMFGLIARGDFEGIQQLERDVEVKKMLPDYQDSTALVAALKSKSIAAARRACPDNDGFFLNIRCMLALAILGDEDGAYAIADKLYPRRVGRTPAETERIWLDEPETAPLEFVTSPGAAPMRRDPRYLPLAERTGLVAYWRSGRPPDFCRQNPEPVCRSLLARR